MATLIDFLDPILEEEIVQLSPPVKGPSQVGVNTVISALCKIQLVLRMMIGLW